MHLKACYRSVWLNISGQDPRGNLFSHYLSFPRPQIAWNGSRQDMQVMKQLAWKTNLNMIADVCMKGW